MTTCHGQGKRLRGAGKKGRGSGLVVRLRGAMRSWLVLVLTALIANPLPVMGQVPPGVTFPSLEGDAQVERRAPTPRTVRELTAFPTITIVEPRNGSIVTREDQGIAVSYRDARDELDLSTFRVFVNGV